MLRRIVAIALILIATSIAWMILGANINRRTYSSNDALKSGVASIWGTPQEQRPPIATFDFPEQQKSVSEVDGKKEVTTETVHQTKYLPIDGSQIKVTFQLDHRQKGLLWYNTYTVDFGGTYTFHNADSEPRLVTFELAFPAQQAVYDGVIMEIDGASVPFSSKKDSVSTSATLAPNQTIELHTGYRSHGLDSWRYKLGDDVAQSRDFKLTMQTNFKEIDFPANTLAPTAKRETPAGWDLTWQYKNLISGFAIGMTMPEKLQPGPLAGEISFFAPVSLLLFFFVMFIITTLRNIELHPMNYFFLAAAFFSFHLLLAYLVDHISIHTAFAIASVVSIFLVVSYLRLVIGLRFAVVEAGLAQLIYLVTFSYTFFLKGFTGLAATIGCIVTLFVVMQMTGGIRWQEKFA